MAAAMDTRVIAVDPILNNLALINQSLQRSNKAQYVSFIRNPIRSFILVLINVFTIFSPQRQGGAPVPRD